MNNLYLKIASKTVSVHYIYKETFDFCRDYIVEPTEPDIVIYLTNKEIEEIIKEEYNTIIPARTDIGDLTTVTVNYSSYESHLLFKKLSDALLDYGILLVHGAAIMVKDKCFIFTAPSGTGKTTHVLNWLKTITGASIINGDKPYIDIINLKVFGSPWCGKEGLGSNASANLSGIVYLEQSKDNRIKQVSFSTILPLFLQQIYIPRNNQSAIRVYRYLDKFKNVLFYHLFCNMDPQSAIVSYNALMNNKYTDDKI